MRLKATAAAPDPRHVRWLDKWGDPTEGFTRDLFGDPAFENREAARRAASVPALVWGNAHRFTAPSAAELFDQITFTSVDTVRSGWYQDDFPLAAALTALAEDRQMWPRFGRAIPRAQRRLPTTWNSSRRISRSSKRPRGRWRRSTGPHTGTLSAESGLCDDLLRSARNGVSWDERGSPHIPRRSCLQRARRGLVGRRCGTGGTAGAHGCRGAPALSCTLCREDRAALERILPAIAGALGSESFLASEAIASANPALILVLAGMNARRLSKLLRRGDGVPVAGYAVHARGTEAGAVLGRCCACRESVVNSSENRRANGGRTLLGARRFLLVANRLLQLAEVGTNALVVHV